MVEQASANQPRSSYKRVRSDQIPELLPKVHTLLTELYLGFMILQVSMAEISEHAKALLVVRFQWLIRITRLCSLRSRLQEIEATEAKYEAAQKSCEVPELAKVAAALCCMCWKCSLSHISFIS